MILALHSLADIFTKIRYSWGQWPKGNAQKKCFFLGRRSLIENEKKAEVLTVSK